MLIRQYVHEQAPFRPVTCPSCKQVLLLQSTSFLKKDTRESYIFLFLTTKRSHRQSILDANTLKEEMYIKLA